MLAQRDYCSHSKVGGGIACWHSVTTAATVKLLVWKDVGSTITDSKTPHLIPLDHGLGDWKHFRATGDSVPVPPW